MLTQPNNFLQKFIQEIASLKYKEQNSLYARTV